MNSEPWAIKAGSYCQTAFSKQGTPWTLSLFFSNTCFCALLILAVQKLPAAQSPLTACSKPQSVKVSTNAKGGKQVLATVLQQLELARAEELDLTISGVTGVSSSAGCC